MIRWALPACVMVWTWVMTAASPWQDWYALAFGAAAIPVSRQLHRDHEAG
jgi:hypothetical protein